MQFNMTPSIKRRIVLGVLIFIVLHLISGCTVSQVKRRLGFEKKPAPAAPLTEIEQQRIGLRVLDADINTAKERNALNAAEEEKNRLLGEITDKELRDSTVQTGIPWDEEMLLWVLYPPSEEVKYINNVPSRRVIISGMFALMEDVVLETTVDNITVNGMAVPIVTREMVIKQGRGIPFEMPVPAAKKDKWVSRLEPRQNPADPNQQFFTQVVLDSGPKGSPKPSTPVKVFYGTRIMSAYKYIGTQAVAAKDAVEQKPDGTLVINDPSVLKILVLQMPSPAPAATNP